MVRVSKIIAIFSGSFFHMNHSASGVLWHHADLLWIANSPRAQRVGLLYGAYRFRLVVIHFGTTSHHCSKNKNHKYAITILCSLRSHIHAPVFLRSFFFFYRKSPCSLRWLHERISIFPHRRCEARWNSSETTSSYLEKSISGQSFDLLLWSTYVSTHLLVTHTHARIYTCSYTYTYIH